MFYMVCVCHSYSTVHHAFKKILCVCVCTCMYVCVCMLEIVCAQVHTHTHALMCVCVCVCLCVCSSVCVFKCGCVLVEPEEGIISPIGTGVTGGCESSDMGARN